MAMYFAAATAISVSIITLVLCFESWTASADPFEWIRDLAELHARAKEEKAIARKWEADVAEYKREEKKRACIEAARIERNKALAAREKAIEKLESAYVAEHGTEEEIEAFANGAAYDDLYLVPADAPDFRELVPMPC